MKTLINNAIGEGGMFSKEKMYHQRWTMVGEKMGLVK
jgi:hypothetical protein